MHSEIEDFRFPQIMLSCKNFVKILEIYVLPLGVILARVAMFGFNDADNILF